MMTTVTSLPQTSAAPVLPPDEAIAEVELLGIPFATLGFSQVVKRVAEREVSRRFAYVATPNAQHLALLHRGVEGFAFGLSHAWFLTCDSRVLQRLGRLLFGRSIPLVTGSDLTMHLLQHEIHPDETVTIIGGDETLRQDLAGRFGLSRIALFSPPFGFSTDPALLGQCIDFIRANPARVVFLACGAPQSEVLAARVVEANCATGVGLCIGASMLFATGRLKRAPLLWQKLGLEWLYRLMQEPRRLGRRLWHAQLPVLGIAARAWLFPHKGTVHLSVLKRR
jgi:N-acetylglucosaminyldiphosphoundecaprenol N-acetyl-beta-D-mannosaminyltransferase